MFRAFTDAHRRARRRDAGATPEELHRRAYSGEFTPEAPLDLRLPVPVGKQA